ncbi:hypothetical protein [Veillonella magna]|uniref:hypothetical protein n=1 Tax=Veillonella magna TaxID=464322 RepID=UPI002666C5EE|nr:hypothetical protein [Veillonella magna]
MKDYKEELNQALARPKTTISRDELVLDSIRHFIVRVCCGEASAEELSILPEMVTHFRELRKDGLK